MNKFKLNIMGYKIEIYAYTFLIYRYIFLIKFELWSDPNPIFPPAEPDPGQRGKKSGPHPCYFRPI